MGLLKRLLYAGAGYELLGPWGAALGLVLEIRWSQQPMTGLPLRNAFSFAGAGICISRNMIPRGFFRRRSRQRGKRKGCLCGWQ